MYWQIRFGFPLPVVIDFVLVFFFLFWLSSLGLFCNLVSYYIVFHSYGLVIRCFKFPGIRVFLFYFNDNVFDLAVFGFLCFLLLTLLSGHVYSQFRLVMTKFVAVNSYNEFLTYKYSCQLISFNSSQFSQRALVFDVTNYNCRPVYLVFFCSCWFDDCLELIIVL